MKDLIRLALLVVVGIVAYNFFMGDQSDKESAKKIVNEVKDLGKATWDLLKSEKEKYDQGKYDEALGKIKDLFGSLKEKAQSFDDDELAEKVASLEERRKKLETQINDFRPDSYGNEETAKKEKEEIMKDWEILVKDTEEIMKDFEEK